MRYINKIAVHHSASSRDWDFEKSVSLININHKSRLHPKANSLGYNVAYHFLVGSKGEIKQTREIKDVGYTTRSWITNLTSIGVCLIGNFENQDPTKQQMLALQDIIKRFKTKYGISPKNVKGHRKYSATACPGRNLTERMIGDAAAELIEEDDGKPSKWAAAAWKVATQKKIITGRPLDPITNEEMSWIFMNLGAAKKPQVTIDRQTFIQYLANLRLI